MVRFLSENGVEDADGMKAFDGMGYRYREELSDEGKFVFVKGT